MPPPPLKTPEDTLIHIPLSKTTISAVCSVIFCRKMHFFAQQTKIKNHLTAISMFTANARKTHKLIKQG